MPPGAIRRDDASEALLTLADGRVGTRGTPEEGEVPLLLVPVDRDAAADGSPWEVADD